MFRSNYDLKTPTVMLLILYDVIYFCEIMYCSNTFSSKYFDVDLISVCGLEKMLIRQGKSGLGLAWATSERFV
jgi:hypothetical protein